MIKLDEAWVRDHWLTNVGEYPDEAMELARIVHDRAVKAMLAAGPGAAVKVPPGTDFSVPLEHGQIFRLPPTPQPRTLFEDAALQEWVRLASESKPTDSGYYARYTPDERVAEAIKAARAFVDAVREQGK